MPDPLTAEFVDDETSIEKPKAETKTQRRKALKWCLNNVWATTDIDTLERIDNETANLHGWAMWERV